MIRALLAGTKTQTRRLAKVVPGYDHMAPSRELCPYGKPGDRLWVRETWGFDSGVRGDFRPSGRHDLSGMDLLTHTLYRADLTSLAPKPPRWRPAIHMPRWASRITLEVTSVRVERLQSISEEDAKAEGVQLATPCILIDRRGREIERDTYRTCFAGLWDEINWDRARWDSNPWVWVVSFRRIAQQ